MESGGQVIGEYKIKSDLIYKAKGCEECNHTGYKGRMVIAEVMLIADQLRQLIAHNAPYNEIRDCARKGGMDTLFESAMRKVEEGITSLDEALGITVTAI